MFTITIRTIKQITRQQQIILRTYTYKNPERVPLPKPSRKQKALTDTTQPFIDTKAVRVKGGKGGDGCISFLQLWANETAGPDGGDGGHGGHVVFEATRNVNHLVHVPAEIIAESGERGYNKDCCGRNAKHEIVQVPIGTLFRNDDFKIVADLYKQGMMFVAARGGAGGKGNHFFASDTNQTPKISEFGSEGEERRYFVELRSMAHVGLIGFPNAGKSTLLRAVSRARPKVAPYPFTTLKPFIGIIEYDDYEQIAIADLPGLIPDSHKNRGLGIQFLRHAERCSILIFVLDLTVDEPWEHYRILEYELAQFSEELIGRPKLILANKTDLLRSTDVLEKVERLRKEVDGVKVIEISAKDGGNILNVLKEVRIMYDKRVENGCLTVEE